MAQVGALLPKAVSFTLAGVESFRSTDRHAATAVVGIMMRIFVLAMLLYTANPIGVANDPKTP